MFAVDGSTCFELRSITLSVLAAFSYKSRLGDVCVCGLQTSRSALSIASSGRHAFFPSYLARTKPALQRKLRGNSRLRWETRFRVQGFDSHNWDKPGEIFEQSRSNGSKLDSNQSSLEFGWCLLRATDLVVSRTGSAQRQRMAEDLFEDSATSRHGGCVASCVKRLVCSLWQKPEKPKLDVHNCRDDTPSHRPHHVLWFFSL